MSGPTVALVAAAASSAVSTVTLLLVVWRGGRWTGRVDTKLEHVEGWLRHLDGCIDSLKREVLRGKDS